MFAFPGTKIPDWFTHHINGESISFWFQGKFPVTCLCLVIGQVGEQAITVKFSTRVFINGNKKSLGNWKVYEFSIATDHILLFDIGLLKFEDNEDVAFSNNNWNEVVVSYAVHFNKNGFPTKLASKYSGIHVSQQRSGETGIQFIEPNSSQSVNSTEADKRDQITSERPQKDQTKVLSSPILSSTQLRPPITDVSKGSHPKLIVPAKSFLDDVTGETSKRLQEEEVHPTTIPNDPSVIQSCCEESSEHESSSIESEGSDSNDPFDHVDRRLSISAEETISSASSSGDASLEAIREAINSLELLMVKDLSEVSSDPKTQSGLHQLLDLLSASSHPKVTVQAKEAIVEFKGKAFLSFQEFRTAAVSVNKLKDFERHLARIKEETVAGKGRWKDLKNSIKKVSLAIEAEIKRKKELETEIATLRIQLSTKERDLEQLVLNLKNQEESLSTYSASYASLNEQAGALFKQADDLLAANIGVKHEGKAAEMKQTRLKSTWSIDLNNQFHMIKSNIIDLS